MVLNLMRSFLQINLCFKPYLVYIYKHTIFQFGSFLNTMSTINQNLRKQQLPLVKTEFPSPNLKIKQKYKPKQSRQKKDRGKAVDVKIEHQVFYSDDEDDKNTKQPRKKSKQAGKPMEIDRGNNPILHSKTLTSPDTDEVKIHEEIMKTIVLKSAGSKNMQSSDLPQSKPALRKKQRPPRKDSGKDSRGQGPSSPQFYQPGPFSLKNQITNTNELKKETQSNIYSQPRLRALPCRMQQRIDLAYESNIIRQAHQTERLAAKNFTKMIHGGDTSLQQKLLNRLVNHSLVCWPDYVSYFESYLKTSYDQFKSKLNYLKSQYMGKRLMFQMQEEQLNYSIYKVKTDPSKAKFYQQQQESLRQARFNHFSERHADQQIDMEPFYRQNRSRSRDKRRRKYHLNSSDSFDRSLLREEQDKNESNLQNNNNRNPEQDIHDSRREYLLPSLNQQNIPKQLSDTNQLAFIQKNVSEGILQKSTKSVSQLQIQQIENQFRQKLTLNKIEQQNQSYTEPEPRFDSNSKGDKKIDSKSNVNQIKQYGRSRASISEFQSKIGNKDIEKELSRINDRKKILASIQVLNRKCEEQEKLFRPQERQEKQKPKTINRQSTSNNMVSISSAISNEQVRRDNSPDDSDSRKYESSVRDSGLWITGQSKGQKVKRLQILNRYHYNPFEQNEGEDHCEVWKKLMCAEISSVRNQYNFSTKTEEFQNSMIDSLLADVDRLDKGRVSHYGKLTQQDFYVKTTYKPIQQKREDTSSVARSKTSPSVNAAIEPSPIKVQNLTNTKTKTNSSANTKNKMLYGLEIERQDSMQQERNLVKEQFPPQPEQLSCLLSLVNISSAYPQQIVRQPIVEEQPPATSTRGKEQQQSQYVDDLENYYENIFQ